MFRDDDAAREERLAALEREASRVESLRRRVEELEAENRKLREQLAAVVPAAPPTDDIYLDSKLVEYIDRIIAATHAEANDQWILSGALQVDAMRIADRAKAIARTVPRHYVVPDDVRRAAAEVLPDRILVRTGDPETIVADILSDVEVP